MSHNQPMSQFEVIDGLLTERDMSRWDIWYGFRRCIKFVGTDWRIR